MIKYKRKDDENIHSKIDDEIVMVNIEHGNYYSLNAVASSIWEILASPKSVEEICDALTEEYDITKEECMEQVEKFVDALLKKGVIDTL